MSKTKRVSGALDSVSADDVDLYGKPMGNIKPNYRPRVRERQEQYRHVGLKRLTEHFRGKARTSNTNRAYAAAVAQYREFCAEHGYEVLPGDVEAVQGFLAHLAAIRGLSVATIRVRFAGLRRFYRDEVGRDNVTTTDAVRACMDGIIRELSEAPVQAPALRAEHVRAIVRALPKGPDGELTIGALRDRAVVLVMYAGALRRSEAASLLRSDCVFTEGGVRILLRSSKTDQESRGHWIGIGYGKRAYTCPVRALQAWFDASPGCDWVFHGVSSWGTVFSQQPITDKGIGRIIQRVAFRAGLAEMEFTSHSLRAGVTTDLNASGLSIAMVQERTRHKSPSMVARYHRPDSVLRTNFTKRAGL